MTRQPEDGLLRVGLTGGIACGKSAVAALFAARGVPVVDDDVAARDAVAAGTPGFAAVVAAFGDVVGADGELDRPKLGRIVFADESRRRRLMELTFPFIAALLRERLAAAEAIAPGMLVYESALLVENGAADAWRPLVVVTATPELQIERMRRRNGLDEAEARRRIAAQMPVREKAARGDFVIDNSGSRADLERRFAEVFAALAESIPGAPVLRSRPGPG